MDSVLLTTKFGPNCAYIYICVYIDIYVLYV